MPMGDKELEEQIAELSQRIAEMEALMKRLAGALLDNRGTRQLQSAASSIVPYMRILDSYMSNGSVGPEIVIPQVKDPISREIISVLFSIKEGNISRITEELRKRRGKASRSIVAKKLAELEEMGVLEADESGRDKKYSLSDEVVRKWLKVLGIDIKGDED